MSKKSTVIESQIESLVALFSDRRLTEALAGADRFIAEHPDHPFGWKLKGALLIEQNQPESALPILQRAIQLSPDEADLLNNFGIALRQTGRLSESLAASQKALGLRPNFAEGHHALAVVLLQMGFLKLAIEHAKEAVQLKPDFPEAWFNLGNACKDALLNEEALQAYVKAFQLRPDMPDVLNNLGNLLRELGKPLEALALYQKAQTIQPELATTYLNLGNLYLDLGQHERAASQYQQALQRDGALIGAQSNLCFCLASSAGADALASMRAAQDYRTMLAQSVQPYANWSAAMAAGQALRIGLVSGDLRLHPVGHFLENVLAELAGTDTELYAYVTQPHEDALTQRLKAHFSGWHSLVGLSDEEAARRIHADGIHILVDLAGHTAHNRLPVFAWKPAPVQVSWLGYFATTGVAQMDYLLADEVGVPAAQQNQFTEKIWYLPETRLCFTPPENAPAVAPAPSLAKDSITFGCFQNLAKIGDAVLVQWQRILDAVPEARLRLQNKPLGDAVVRERFTERLKQHGIDPGRVELHGNAPRDQYLTAHAEVDILLDTFPYPGGTTTCEALWMGVPTITLAGDTLLARQGASLLTAAGLSEWVAHSEEEYVGKAITFAQNPATLAALRAGLRERVARSPLFDAQRFAKNLYQAFLSMWQQAQSLASDVLNDSCRQAADFSPEAHSAELVNLFNQGQYAECEALARQLTQRAPNYGFGWNVLGVLYKQLGRIEEALVAMEQAAVLLPEDAEVLNNYGATLQNLHRSQAAEPYLRRAIALKPDYVEAYNNLAATLHELDRYSEAEACLHQAIALRPSYPEAWYNLGNTLKQQGRLEEAEQSLLQALALRPNWPSAYTMLLFCLNYGQHQDARTRLSHARQYGDLLTRMAERPYKDWRCDAVPKRLRVGLASPDLRTHPVGYFLESVLADLGHTGIELVAYPTFPHEDALTQRLKAHFVGWHSLVGLSDEEAARRIHADGIHILVDLAGHTAHNRLPVFAWKPAPVQVSWLGYFATTGVAQMDYLLADEVGVPAAQQNQFTEKIWYLPETRLCFTPPENAPAVAPAPSSAKDSITFGCFQNLAKIGDAVLVQWQRILDAVPEARLRLQNKPLGDAVVRERFTERLKQHGIDPGRVELHGNAPRDQYLAAHAEVDILLDTFPYPGGTTTCEALWMGVPTITLAGDTLLARQGASLLTAAGLPDWVAHSEDEYVGKAITFAQNPASLAVLRAGLRERVARSPLFDAPRFASHLSQALWVMWRELSITRLAQNENAAPVMSDAAPQAQQAMDAIVALYQQGRFAEVEAAARKFCNDYPEHFFGWKILGTLCVQFGHTDLAIAHLEKAISLAPEDVGTYSNLGVALKNLGRRDEAITCYRRALAVKPDYAEAHCNLGNALREAGQLAEAIEHCRQAVGLRPDYAEAHANLGAAFLDSGNFSDAKTCCENALKLKPDQPRVLSNLGAALKDLGQIDAALMALRRAVELQPDYAEAHNNLGVVFHECGLLDHAKQSYHQAVQLKPDYAEAFNNLGNTLKADGELEASAAARRRALEINPSYAEAYNNLGVVLQDEGRLPEAVDCYRRTLEIKPSFIEAHSNLIFCLNFDERFSAEDRLLEARAFGEKVQEKATEFRAWKSSATVLPDRLRIGFVSGDLKIHPVGFFLENALSCLSTNLELYAYVTQPHEDALTQRLKAHFSGWHSLVGLSDEEAARRIHADGIHILVDLAGHTAHNRLPVFAWKPAPVQVSWLGYFATTGVAQMDYLLADEVGVPAAQQNQFTEKIWYLPETRLCFTPPENAPAVAPAPSLAKDSITFGCFQNLAKIGDAVLVQWQRILDAVPEARLRLQNKPLGDAVVRERFTERLKQHGIDPGRVELHGNVPRDQYLTAHAEVDILLDTFPYPGGTTTCEALWMGVPTITLAGDTLLARQGASLLTAAGLSEWVAHSEEEYVGKAVTFAQNPATLASLRSGLREMTRTTLLFNAECFSANLEAGLLAMWKSHIESDF